jgi:hypothetical protein
MAGGGRGSSGGRPFPYRLPTVTRSHHGTTSCPSPWHSRPPSTSRPCTHDDARNVILVNTVGRPGRLRATTLHHAGCGCRSNLRHNTHYRSCPPSPSVKCTRGRPQNTRGSLPRVQHSGKAYQRSRSRGRGLPRVPNLEHSGKI